MSVRDVPQVPTGADDHGGVDESVGDRAGGWEHLSHADPRVRAFVDATRAAGNLAQGFFRSGETTSAAISEKAGGSPVTEADEAVNLNLERELLRIAPDAAWLSEESFDSLERLDRDLVLVVDPIDGTRGFVAGHADWAVAVALVYRSRPILGIVHAPALSQTYVAVKNGGARLNDVPIHVSDRSALAAGAKLAAPKPLARTLRDAGVDFELLPKVPSLALRIAYVAAGALDATLIAENSRDWDIAASDIILQEAGGRLTSLDGEVPTYNRRDTRHGVLVAAPAPIIAQIRAAAPRLHIRSKST
jgi:myo-inositol-1(or 4)-monophosphatase